MHHRKLCCFCSGDGAELGERREIVVMMCLAAAPRLPHVHVFLLPLPCGLDCVFHFGASQIETVSLGSGIPSMPWGVG